MAADGFGDRVAFGSRQRGLTYAGLHDQARRAAAWAGARGVEHIGLVDVNSEAVPILMFGSGVAGLPFVPVNYRLADAQLGAILARIAPAVVVVEEPVLARVSPIDGIELITRGAFLDELERVDPGDTNGFADPEDTAILLFTSGTTGEPKAAVLRHKHLTSYVIGTVEFMGAGKDEAALVSVPPYHIAGASAVLTSLYAGRRIAYLSGFTPEAWVAAARDEAVTQAMVVPTMLGRILDVLERDGERLPRLQHLSYGGGRMPVPVIERALTLLPHVDFVNAYGLTETSSTIAVLGPKEHRDAVASDDPVVRRRLGSVGRPLPTLEVEIRDEEGKPVEPGGLGELWVRGEQVAGEYLDRSAATETGWFPTRDSGFLDDDGYLYLTGRLDDVIVRGGENMSPGEIEDVLVAHPSVADAAVVGVPDTEWGEAVVAAVVLMEGSTTTRPELEDWVRSRLRSSKTPERIEFRQTLPYNDMGKLLRRVLKAELAAD
ncbi:MAG TPA: AMP-binding protein [Acidimicrobiales bacterium]|nr:AMP-binding protein [Acidimicrobiales bacterium]